MQSVAASETERCADAQRPGAVMADVAAGLLQHPALGITRVRVIGLPERDTVHLAVAAAAEGLAVESARDARGGLTVALTSPAAAPATLPAELTTRERGWLKRCLRALTRGGRQ